MNKTPEYIERERAKAYLIGDYAYAAAKVVDEVPAADVVEVVRCENCIFSQKREQGINYNCTSTKGRFGLVKPKDFCSYGERRSKK